MNYLVDACSGFFSYFYSDNECKLLACNKSLRDARFFVNDNTDSIDMFDERSILDLVIDG